MSGKVPRLILMVCALSPSLTWALGLGEIHLNSALNEPMRAEIDLIAATPEELTALRASLAGRDAFARYGVDRPPFLSSLVFKVGKSKDKRDVLFVTSTDAIPEPFVTFLVEVNWSRGRLMREYTLLLDPPVYSPGETATSSAPVVAAATAPAAATTAAATTAPGRHAGRANRSREAASQRRCSRGHECGRDDAGARRRVDGDRRFAGKNRGIRQLSSQRRRHAVEDRAQPQRKEPVRPDVDHDDGRAVSKRIRAPLTGISIFCAVARYCAYPVRMKSLH
jgi:hypothetical protein